MYFLHILGGQIAFILPYWVVGILLGSAVAVFGKARIHALLLHGGGRGGAMVGLVAASGIGIASPLCMYGTIPLAAAFAQKGVRQDWLAAFMMSSVLLNPQLLLYTAALGWPMVVLRVAACLFCGVAAGLCVRAYNAKHEVPFLNFAAFRGGCRADRDTHPNLLCRYALNVWRNVKATAPWFAVGILLAAAGLAYIPADFMAAGSQSLHGGDVVLLALAGIPFYVCGGGAIPLIGSWLDMGMTMGAALAFTLTGAATKITNVGALAIVLGTRGLVLYTLFVFFCALLCGGITNLLF